MQAKEVQVVDQDGDRILVKQVFGFGGPTLVVRVTQDSQEANVNVSLAGATVLRNYLTNFIERSK